MFLVDLRSANPFKISATLASCLSFCASFRTLFSLLLNKIITEPTLPAP